jgi:UrcA family protein
MKKISYAIIAAASVLASGMVMAQNLGEITIEATRNMNVKVNTSPVGAKVKDISLSYLVSTAGLNLAVPGDVTTLQNRVKDAAATACKEIGEQYPASMPDNTVCTKVTADKAMIKVNELVAAAGKTSK